MADYLFIASQDHLIAMAGGRATRSPALQGQTCTYPHLEASMFHPTCLFKEYVLPFPIEQNGLDRGWTVGWTRTGGWIWRWTLPPYPMLPPEPRNLTRVFSVLQPLKLGDLLWFHMILQ